MDWRSRIGEKKKSDKLSWKISLYEEFIQFVDKAFDLSVLYNWDFWGGGTDNYAVTFSQGIIDGKSLSIRMISTKKYSYWASFSNKTNPNNIEFSEYDSFISETMDETLEYIREYLLKNEDVKQRQHIRFRGCGYDRCILKIKQEKERLTKVSS